MRWLKLFCLGLIITQPALAADKPLILACSEWPPYISAQLPGQGFYSQIVREAGKIAGLKIETRILPWKRVVAETKSGQIDGISCPSFDTARESWLIFTDQDFYIVRLGLFEAIDRPLPQWQQVSDLKKHHLASLAGSIYLTHLKELSDQTIHPDHFPNLATGLKMLAAHRFDGIYMVRDAGYYLLDHELPGLKSQIRYAGTLRLSHVRPAFGRQHEFARNAADRLSTGYERIKRNGKLAQILNQSGIRIEAAQLKETIMKQE